jgi:hypothetical protein
MMPLSPLAVRVLELVALFNRQTQDLPDGLLDKDCTFSLNGRAYHDHLGRPATDPIVRLVGCGPAGYRFLTTALRYAIATPRVMLDESSVTEEADGHEARTFAADGVLSGTLRGDIGPSRAPFHFTVRASHQGTVCQIAVLLGEADCERILAARRR